MGQRKGGKKRAEEQRELAEGAGADAAQDELPAGVPPPSSRWGWFLNGTLVLLATALVALCGWRWGPVLLVPFATIAIIAVGRWASRAPRYAVTIARWAASRRGVWAGAILVVLLLGAAGVSAERAHARRCATNQELVEMWLGKGYVDTARRTLSDRADCDPAITAALEAEVKTAEKAEADLKTRAQARAQAEARAAKERDAVADFPEDAATVRRSLKEAAAHVARNDAKSAALLIVSSRTMLENYKGTSVEQSADWRELYAQQQALQQKVQPYLDAQQALIDGMRKDLEERAAQDRRDGVKLTREGWIAATSPDKLEQVSRYKTAGDEEGIALLLRTDPGVVKLKDGIRVVVIEQIGVLNRYVHVRVKGTDQIVELWTYPEALRDP